MPELARFFGMIVTIFYDDHPPPHFHVRYGSHKAIIAIQTLERDRLRLTSTSGVNHPLKQRLRP